jgi:hypothetical protein
MRVTRAGFQVGRLVSPHPNPCLSLGEREQSSSARANPTGLRFIGRLAQTPPLPKREGWGEGERDLPRPRDGLVSSAQWRRGRPSATHLSLLFGWKKSSSLLPLDDTNPTHTLPVTVSIIRL